ncbi:16S rRNA (uracil(1498)-N(3))-methyltransferase [Fretibacter rubidus]|uniref:16S rRNA (uracil(1498)-N(3))-methyltransferase n=1 Tax=Fretibacter rubidus TaxID=570162 RepID=UPI00352A2BF9
MRENYTLTRLYVDTPLNAGAAVTLEPAQAHYLGTVLRKSVSDTVRIFNGHDGEWAAEISMLSKRGGSLIVTDPLRRHHDAPDIWLVFAPVRKHRTAFIFEKATELGVSKFVPVITARTQFAKLNTDKARAQIIEAAEQTERLDLPEVAKPKKLDSLLDNWDKGRRIIFADEAGGGHSVLDILRNYSGPCALLIGPEGGFTEAERDRLLNMDCVDAVSLGPRILRADTAAISLLTLWQSAQGDW